MLDDKLKFIGTVNIKHFDKNGILLEEINKNNLVVTTGISFIISRMFSASVNPMTHMAIGSNANIPVAGDSTLGTELTRVAFSSLTLNSNNIVFVGNYPAGVGTGLVQEAGIFNAASSGTMLNRVTFGSINKDTDDSILITWTLTLG